MVDPVVTPDSAPVAAPAPEAAPAAPQTAAEARAAIGPHNALMPMPHWLNQPRNEVGQFTTPAADAPGAEATPTTAAEPAPVPSQPVTTAADAPVEGFVRIPLPEAHPLRERGLSHIDAPVAQEDYFRWAVQNAVRREHIVQWENHAKAMEQRALEAEARYRAFQEVPDQELADPRIRHMLADLEQAYGPEVAKRMRDTLLSEKLDAKAREYTEAAQRQQAEQAAQATATQFAESAYQEAQRRFPDWTMTEFNEALAAYGNRMEMAGSNQPSLGEFLTLANALYVSNPRLQPVLAQRRAEFAKQQEERVRAQLAAEEQKKLEEQAALRRDLPFRRVSPAMHQPNTTPGTPQTAAEARAALMQRGHSRRNTG